jgi:hypothetical protein|eukprot:COSAG06_NODE_4090_length_4585_cov_2.219795_8_plen_88_part_00
MSQWSASVLPSSTHPMHRLCVLLCVKMQTRIRWHRWVCQPLLRGRHWELRVAALAATDVAACLLSDGVSNSLLRIQAHARHQHMLSY